MRGNAVEDMAEAIPLGHLLEFRARIGDGDEAAPGFLGSNRLL